MKMPRFRKKKDPDAPLTKDALLQALRLAKMERQTAQEKCDAFYQALLKVE